MHFAKFLILRFSKVYCSPFSSKFSQALLQACIQGQYRLLLFVAICQILKVPVYVSLKISYLSYIASIHKAMLVSSVKGSSRASRASGDLVFSRVREIGGAPPPAARRWGGGGGMVEKD